jgi:hypothetical protein
MKENTAIRAEFQVTVDRLEKRVDRLELENASLRSRLDKNSGNSSKPPSTDSFTKPASKARSLRESSGKPQGKQAGSSGASLLMTATPDRVLLDAKLESELIDLDGADAAELLESTGQSESGLNQLARIGFDTLGLQTYLTAGPKECRAWTIHKGWTAPQAAGVIHTDFQKGFIKAEIFSFEDLMAAGSIAEARSKGKARMEGKDYVMQDGDVVEFRFNV